MPLAGERYGLWLHSACCAVRPCKPPAQHGGGKREVEGPETEAQASSLSLRPCFLTR